MNNSSRKQVPRPHSHLAGTSPLHSTTTATPDILSLDMLTPQKRNPLSSSVRHPKYTTTR